MNRPLAIRMAAAMVCLASSAAFAAADRPRVILVTQEKGYVHAVAERRDGQPSLVESTLAKLSRDSNVFDLTCVNDVRLLSPRTLKSAKVVIFFTNGELPFPDNALPALETWVKQGGACLFLHPATDTLRSNPTWHNLVGGTYAGHPFPDAAPVTFKVLDAANPATQSFGETFTLADPVPQENSVDRNAVHELIAVDAERTPGARPVHIPVAWCREYEKGKLFTTTLGHNAATWENPAFQQHLLGALKWLLNVDKADAKPNPAVAAHEDEIIARLHLPPGPNLPQIGEGLKLSVFAEAPQFKSPSSMCVSADGRVFVGEDEYNTGNDRHLNICRVKMLADTKGTGKADKVTVFADKICAPQGMTFVGDTLYVVNAPFLTAFRDTNGDGVADERRDLITGFGPVPEGLVHHIPSGVHMAADGFLYVTVGDKGIVKATGTDGQTVSLHGGGIVRVRPDGSEMEVFCSGNRNPYSAAPDPFLNLFMRDNTNDGGGWNSRLSQMQRGAQYGYPTLFTNFGDEIIPCIADYGGGGATGSVFVHEPYLPKPYGNSLYTIDWGRSWVYRHNLTPSGATFKPDQEEFVFGSFPTSIDADASGHLFISNWGRLSWGEAPPVGSIYKIQSTESKAPPFPNLRELSDTRLVQQLTSDSAVLRRETQSEILRRNNRAAAPTILAIVRTPDLPLDARVNALFTYAQLQGRSAIPTLATLTQDPTLREFAIRALADRPTIAPYVNAELFTAYLHDENPRVRTQSAIALGKCDRADLASYLVPLTADSDIMARHAAQQSLRELNAVDACLAALQNPPPTCGTGLQPVLSSPTRAAGVSPASSPEQITTGILRTLRSMHDPRVVSALAAFLPTTTPALKKESLKTLQRLYTVEAPWDGSWWLTRPDTSGPNYKPARWPGTPAVGELFVTLINDPNPEVAKSALAAAGHVRATETAATLASLIRSNSPLKADATRALINLRSASPESLAAVESVVVNPGWDEGLVNQSLDVLGSLTEPAAHATLLRVVAKLDAEEKPRNNILEKAASILSTQPATGDLVIPTARLLSAKKRPARNAAALSLARSPDPAAQSRIAAIWTSGDDRQLEALLAAIPSLPDAAAKPHLDHVRALLRDPRQPIRHAAITARPRFADAGVVTDLLAASKPFKDRTTAAVALATIDPAKVPPERITPATGLLAETAASLQSSPDKDAYNKLLSAAQKYLTDARVPRDKAAAWIRDLKQSGVIADYLKTDPIPAEPGKAFTAVLPPDQHPGGPFTPFAVAGKPYEFKPVIVTDPAGVLPLSMPANTVTFLTTTVSSGTGGPAVLTAGSDDGLQVYLNGRKVLANDANRPTKADQDRALVQLQPGTNTLLLRVNNNAGDAGVQARIRQRPTDFDPAELESILKDIPGSAARGQALFDSLGCIKCHTIDPQADPKGPYLGDAGAKFQRPHLIESILRPSAKIAQGFTTVKVATATADYTGWVTREASDSLTLRDAAGQSNTIPKSQVTSRTTLPQSMMPEGLLNSGTLEDLSSLLAYLSTLNAKP